MALSTIQRVKEKGVCRSIFVHLTQRSRIRIARNFSCRLVPFIALFEKKSGFQMPPNPYFPIYIGEFFFFYRPKKGENGFGGTWRPDFFSSRAIKGNKRQEKLSAVRIRGRWVKWTKTDRAMVLFFKSVSPKKRGEKELISVRCCPIDSMTTDLDSS